MKYIDEYIEYFYEKMGPDIFKEKVPEDVINEYSGRLPNTLIKYWKEYGWCGYGGGIFWTVNPKKYSVVVDEWLKGTVFEDYDDYHLIALGGFGEMYLWGEKTGNSLSITASYGMMSPTDKSDFIKRKSDNYELLVKSFFSGIDKKYLDEQDENGNGLFDKAATLLGCLYPGEIYGFSPAIPMGGKAVINHVKKVDAVSYLYFLASLGEKIIMEDITKVVKERNK